MIDIDKALLGKYSTYGPRYTSYPTALQFNHDFSTDDYCWHVKDSNEDLVPTSLSLYLHIPFCQSLCYYCGCHKIVTQDKAKAQPYIELLTKEIALQGKLFVEDRQVKQIHFGGGTPTYLDYDEIHQLIEAIDTHFTLAPASERETSIEIDPRTTSIDDINKLANSGFNRMSFGIQDFNPEVQHAINRIQSEEQTLTLLNAAREAWVDSISVDLIYGLPRQTLEGFDKTLESIIHARPDRIALYHYAHMPQKIKAQKLINEYDIPDTEEKLLLLSHSIEKLTAAGYEYIGMDHFALPDDPLSHSLKEGTLQRNFQGYSTHNHCDTIGLGVSSISKIGHCFSQNYKNISDYYSYINKGQLAIEKGCKLSFDDTIRSIVIQQIMCRQQVDIDYFNCTQSIPFEEYFHTELMNLAPMIDDGLVLLSRDRLQITPKGRFFLRNIAMVFDHYLQQQEHLTSLNKHSKIL